MHALTSLINSCLIKIFDPSWVNLAHRNTHIGIVVHVVTRVLVQTPAFPYFLWPSPGSKGRRNVMNGKVLKAKKQQMVHHFFQGTLRILPDIVK